MTISKLLLLLCLILFCIPTTQALCAPNIQWNKTYGRQQREWPTSVIELSDGDYLITGYTYMDDSDGDVCLIKTNSNGEMLWNKTYGGSEGDFGKSVIELTDGNYLIVGTTYSYGSEIINIYLIKTDQNGTIIWEKTYSKFGENRGVSVVEVNDGGYLITGYTNPFGSTNDADVYLVKTNTTGGVLWSKTYGNENRDNPNSMVELENGDFLVAGSTKPVSVGTGNAFLMKTNSNGNRLWNRTYDTYESNDAQSIAALGDGGYLMVGSTAISGSSFSDICLMKTDSDGGLIWNKTYGGPVNDIGRSVIELSNGGYLITGDTKIYEHISHYDAILFRTDPNGVMLWNITYGEAQDDRGISSIETSTGEYLFVGNVNPSTRNDVFLLKTGVGLPIYRFRVVLWDGESRRFVPGPVRVNGRSTSTPFCRWFEAGFTKLVARKFIRRDGETVRFRFWRTSSGRKVFSRRIRVRRDSDVRLIAIYD